MPAGRIETYVHSDAITAHKGGAIVKVTCQTDLAARTKPFVDFAGLVARMSYASDATSWADVMASFPDLEETRRALAAELGEPVTITDIAILKI